MGKPMMIQLPDEVQREIDRHARERGVTVEDFIASAAAEKAGAIDSATRYFADRAPRAEPGSARALFPF